MIVCCRDFGSARAGLSRRVRPTWVSRSVQPSRVRSGNVVRWVRRRQGKGRVRGEGCNSSQSVPRKEGEGACWGTWGQEGKAGWLGLQAYSSVLPELSLWVDSGRFSRCLSASRPPRSGGWQWPRITVTRSPWVMARLRQPCSTWSRHVQYTLSPTAFSRLYRNDSCTRKLPP